MALSPKPADVLAVLEQGDTIATDDVPTIEFSGRTWFVHNFAGHQSKGVMLMTNSPERPEHIGDVIEAYMLAAVNVAILTMDWSKVTPAAVAECLSEMLTRQFENIHRQHMHVLANRKPS